MPCVDWSLWGLQEGMEGGMASSFLVWIAMRWSKFRNVSILPVRMLKVFQPQLVGIIKRYKSWRSLMHLTNSVWEAHLWPWMAICEVLTAFFTDEIWFTGQLSTSGMGRDVGLDLFVQRRWINVSYPPKRNIEIFTTRIFDLMLIKGTYSFFRGFFTASNLFPMSKSDIASSDL